MSKLRGVVVAHGNLARCLVETTESISGVTGSLVPISNEGCSPEVLSRKVAEALESGPALLFVDLASGSCAHAARYVCETNHGIPVVSGVNLPMLLDFVFHLDMGAPELARRVVEKGRLGVTAQDGSGA
jgi:mannose/fructose-specific phosphotransferase system component IIA